MELLDSISRIQVLGFIILLVGLIAEFWINRRKFNRKNKYGVFIYKDYEHMVVLRVWERLVKVSAYIFIFSGLFLLVLDMLSRK